MFQSKSVWMIILVFLLVRLVIVGVKAQESGSVLPTPSPSLPPFVYSEINREALADPQAFILDQKIKQATRALFATPNEQKAHARKTLMQQAIRQYSYVFLANALTPLQIVSFDPTIQSYLEKPAALIRVELGILYQDDFEKHENSRYEYSLQDLKEKKQFNFYPAGKFAGHISGTTLNVNGVVLDEEVAARVAAAPAQGGGENNNDPIPTNVEILKEASTHALGPQRSAVIFVYPKGTDTTQLPPKEQIFNSILKGNVQAFFKESSYGKMWLDEEKSHMYGWYEEPENIVAANYPLEISEPIDNDIDLTQYDRIMFGVYSRFGGHSSLGKWSFEDKQSGNFRVSIGTFTVHTFYENFFNEDTFIHEFGHGLGLGHASSWNCALGGCRHEEYGNQFDTMGQGHLQHFNGYFKHVLQWLYKPVLAITASGEYTLQSLENSDAVVAKIYRPGIINFPIYYVETRLPIGFDKNSSTIDNISGIHINWIYQPLETRLILNPEQADQLWEKPSIRWGSSFYDKPAGLTVTNIDDKTIKVQFEEPAVCTPSGSTLKESAPYILSSLLPSDEAQKNLNCNNVKCILKRKKQEIVGMIFRFYITNNNSYSCPGVRMRSFVEDPQSQAFEGEDLFTLNSVRTNFVSFPILFFSTTPSGVYQRTLKIENLDENVIILSLSKEIEIQDDFPTLEGDVNKDSSIDIFDLVTVGRNFGSKGEDLSGDVNNDGTVDVLDLVVVAKNFGKKL